MLGVVPDNPYDDMPAFALHNENVQFVFYYCILIMKGHLQSVYLNKRSKLYQHESQLK